MLVVVRFSASAQNKFDILRTDKPPYLWLLYGVRLLWKLFDLHKKDCFLPILWFTSLLKLATKTKKTKKTLCDKICQFSPGTPVSFTNKTECHDRYNWNMVQSGIKYHNLHKSGLHRYIQLLSEIYISVIDTKKKSH